PTFVNQHNRGNFVTVRDPVTGQAFPNNIIPTSRSSSVSRSFVNQFWEAPQLPGLVANQFLDALRPLRRDKIDGRLDYTLSEKHSLFGRYGWSIYIGTLPSTG